MELRGTSRWWLPVALSLGAHLALLVYLASRPPPVVPKRPAPIEVQIYQAAAPPSPPPTAVAPAEPASAPPARRQVATRPPAAATPEPLELPVPDPPLADAPRAISLVPEASLAAPSGFAVRSDVPTVHARADDGRGLAPPSLAPEQLVSELVRDTVGRGKVERGMVHPYFAQLGKALIKSWDADRAVSQHGLKGFAEQMQRNTQEMNRIWLERAAAYGGSGTPADRSRPDTDAARRRSYGGTLSPGVESLAARNEMRRQMASQFRSTRRATLRVIQDRSGRLLSVDLLSPSHDANVDREAVADVRAAAEQFPPPPEEALSGRSEVVSLWQFELIVSISPPVPTFTFEFDEALKFIDARLPLDRRIYKKVKLLSVN